MNGFRCSFVLRVATLITILSTFSSCTAEYRRKEAATRVHVSPVQSSTFHPQTIPPASPSVLDGGHGSLTTLVPNLYIRHQRYGRSTTAASPVVTRARFRCKKGCAPHRSRLTSDEMLKKLGADFNRKWMSIEAPQPEVLNNTIKQSIDTELHEKLSHLDFTYRDESGTTHPIRASVRNYIEKWLVQKSSCSILMTWEDLGELFWPRWIRHGSCTTSVSCSWPPGMYCSPEVSKTIHILRWQCRPSSQVQRRKKERQSLKGGTGKMRCRWKKVPYPITARCFCSC